MKNHSFTKSFLGGIVGSIAVLAAFTAISHVTAAPTQAPPNGNPTFPLQGPQGNTGNTGNQGPAGPTGPQGPAGGTNCTVCLRQCDFNGAGPCGSTCANEGSGYSTFQVQGGVDGNDQFSISIDC